MNERDSEFKPIDDFITGPKREPWPPEKPAPGMEFRRMPTGSSSWDRKERHIDSMLVPVVVDERAFYQNCWSSRLSPGPENACRGCRGARFQAVVRHAEWGLVATGKARVCSVCHGRGW